jgi:hypothetical protein
MTIIRSRRRWVVAAGALAAVGLGVLAYVVFQSWYQQSPASWPTEAFSAERWASRLPTERYKLYNDLAQRKVLLGKSLEEIVSLLGKPDYVAPDRAYVTYIMKSGSGEKYSTNFVYLLHIDLNDGGTVRDFGVRSD